MVSRSAIENGTTRPEWRSTPSRQGCAWTGWLRIGRIWFALCCGGFGAYGCDACSSSGDTVPRSIDVPAAPGGLSREQAAQVLAKVADRSITLGDYAAALDRMDPLERIRYQTPDRRQALLDEMINVELLALEAERRGLDKKPETIELVREFQRDELLRRLRAGLPAPADLTAAEVSDFYRDHHADFSEPERRRAAQITVADERVARRLLADARGSSAERWRELFEQNAAGSRAGASGDRTVARPPLEVAGDLGMLEARDAERRDAKVPAAIVRAVFEIAEEGQIYPELVAHDGKFHVVRLVSKIAARQRLLSEVDDAIRARIIEQRQAEARATLLTQLRQATTVSIDETALEQMRPPSSAAAGDVPH